MHRMAERKKEILVKYHEAVRQYQKAIRQPCSKSSDALTKKQKAKLDIKMEAKEEIAKHKSDSADKEAQIKEWEKDGFTAEAIQAKLKIEELRHEYEEALNDFEVAQEKVKKAWSGIKNLKSSEERTKAKKGLEALKKDRHNADQDRLEALSKYKQAINYYKSIDNKYTKYSKQTKEGWYDEAEWQVYFKKCEDQGVGKKYCAAKFKSEQLRGKYEHLKEDWAELHKENQVEW